MLPYIGENYSTTKTLLIAESFYLPNECILNKNSEVWYKSTENELNDFEKQWINCRGLVECNWQSKGHFLFKEIDRTLRTNIKGGFEKIAFMNAFQRPACKEGESFKYDCENIDVEIAYKTINKVQQILQPEKIIFVTKYGWDMLNLNVTEEKIAKIYDFTCHPGTGGRYWNKANYPHGKSKFIKLLTTKC